jgi:hypothetical protein
MNLAEWMFPEDLAPGDAKSVERDWSDAALHRIDHTDGPLFDMAFGALWAEFGHAGEMEQADVLAKRMEWNPAHLVEGCALRYRMMLVTCGNEFAGVRDHTAIVLEDYPGAVVHLSHNLVAPAWRRSGLAGWMRALPVTTARNVLEAQHRPPHSPITLVGEMEHPDPTVMASIVRLKAYEKAGYLKVDPSQVNYLQPDFRPPEVIDRDGTVRPIPLSLIVRRVGKESEETISGAEVRQIATSLYRMYGMAFRRQDMAGLFHSLLDYPAPDERIRLLPPTAS